MILSKHPFSKTVTIGGKFAGMKHVMYRQRTGEYVNADCRGTTSRRVYAWTGTVEQSKNARRIYGIDEEFELFLDGQETHRA